VFVSVATLQESTLYAHKRIYSHPPTQFAEDKAVSSSEKTIIRNQSIFLSSGKPQQGNRISVERTSFFS
jgi:hypothetical protein